MKKGIIYLLGAIVLIVSSCTKNVEELKVMWQEENLELEGLKSEYKTFSPFINEVQEKAKVDFDAALLVKDEDKQRDALNLAIKKLNSGVVLKLNKVIKLNKSIQASLRYIKVSFSEDEYGFKTYDAVQEAKRTVRNVENMGYNRSLNSATEALVFLNKVISKLEEPEHYLTSITNKHKAKVKAERARIAAQKKQEKANSNTNVSTTSSSSSTNNSTPAAPVVKEVKCPYCGVKQAKGSSCKKCGGKL